MKDIIRKLAIHIDPSLKPKEKPAKGIVGKVMDMIGFSGKNPEEQKKNEKSAEKKTPEQFEYTPPKSKE